MKAIILGDMHIGARNDHLVFAENHISFFENQLFPYMKKHDITTIFQLGDVFDRRKFINFQVWDMWKTRVFGYMKTHGIDFRTLLGNHDIYYKNTHTVSGSMLLLSESYDNIIVYAEPTIVDFHGTNIAIIPWMTHEAEASTLDFIAKTKNTHIAMGHLEVSGFEMDKGNKFAHGIDAEKLSKFHTVYSGHFHHRNDNEHIFYMGTPYQITWIDHGSTKGFTVWDSVSLDTEYIVNDDCIFQRLAYDDTVDDWAAFDYASIKDKFIELTVINKNDPIEYDAIIAKIYEASPADVRIIETVFVAEDDTETLDPEALANTIAVFEKYIDDYDTPLDKNLLKSKVRLLHTEAMNMELA